MIADKYAVKCRHCYCLVKGQTGAWYCDGPHKWNGERFHNVQLDVLRRCTYFSKRQSWQKRVYVKRKPKRVRRYIAKDVVS